MKTIKSSSPTLRAHFGGLPSAALKAMVAGLLAADKSKTHFVDMESFGRVEGVEGRPLCFGCAATWSLQAALGRPMTPGEVAAQVGLRQFADQRWEPYDIHRFEEAIDMARLGSLEDLFVYMRKKSHFAEKYNHLFCLNTSNWREQLPAVRKLIRKLIKLNL
jgi:hypothetical protein